jgi:hypothetical protein
MPHCLRSDKHLNFLRGLVGGMFHAKYKNFDDT